MMLAENDGALERGPWFDEVLDAIAGEIRLLHNMEARGPLAELRRLDKDQSISPALMRIIVKAVPARSMGARGLAADEHGSYLDINRRYALVCQIMALKPDALRRSGLGTALLAAGVSEARLSMLLSARGATFRDIARRIAIRLARSADVAALPYRELGTLILLDSRPSFDPATDRIRMRIAEDYQRAAAGRPGDN